ncbi:MAG: hypothetical protein EX271_04405 [Acidimicrobiales bacterium]|nr:hypothetical protein [Hyphomonadaceae bacterium]RZV43164.1 MAG: hypothetical protein EX271_04405 [Acidimicrobiales bacterium]
MKFSILSKLILAFAMLTLTAVLLPIVQTPAYAQSKMSPPVTGQNLRVAHFPGGRFELTAPGSWGEYDHNGVRRYTFREMRRDVDTVYLREDALAVDLELNATRRIIMASWPGMALHQLHRIDRVEAGPRIGGPLIVTPPPPPPVITPPPLPPAPVNANPNNLAMMVYPNGRFEEAGSGSGVWTHFINSGGVSTFKEIGHDQDTVYLYDRGRNVLVLLEVDKKLIRESRNGGPVIDQYKAIEVIATQSPPIRPERPVYALTNEQRMQCLASGGRVERAGILGAERCTLSYSDGGQICMDSSQCQGKCVAELAGANQTSASGVCQRTDNPFGCFAFVENGQTGPALCVD